MIGFTVQSLGGHQSWSGRYGQEKFSLAYLESNQVSKAVQPPYRLRYIGSFTGNIYRNIVLKLFTVFIIFKLCLCSSFNFHPQLMTVSNLFICFYISPVVSARLFPILIRLSPVISKQQCTSRSIRKVHA
jgi:hypothetical protein